jgi:hypothetical protein
MKIVRSWLIVLLSMKSKFIIFLFFIFQIWKRKISYRRRDCLSRLPPSTPYQYKFSKLKFSLSHASLKNLLNFNRSDEVTTHRLNRCRKVSRLVLFGITPLHKKHSSLYDSSRCDSLSPVRKQLLRHLKINSRRLLSRNVQFQPDIKFFRTFSSGLLVNVILAKLLITVSSVSLLFWRNAFDPFLMRERKVSSESGGGFCNWNVFFWQG